MTITTAIKSKVLASLHLTKVITADVYVIPSVSRNAVYENKEKVIYKASVLNNDEYKDVIGAGRTEMDALKKLNDSLIDFVKINHPERYEELVEMAKADEARRERKKASKEAVKAEIEVIAA